MIKMDNMLWMCLESPHRCDSNTHPKHMILSRPYDNEGKKTLVFCENFMSTETFT